MSRDLLRQMLDMLTGAYNREDVQNAHWNRPSQTNIGKLFELFAWTLSMLEEQCQKVLDWDTLDNAQGAVLDRYGLNYGVSREGASDAFYRLMIKVKLMAQLSGGDLATVRNAAALLFGVENDDLALREVFPAKLWISVDRALLSVETEAMSLAIHTMIKRILAAGVGLRLYLVDHVTRRNDLYVHQGVYVLEKITVRPPTIEYPVGSTAYFHTSAQVTQRIRVNPIIR